MDKMPVRRLLIASTLLLATAPALAGGALDGTFDGTGIVITPTPRNDYANALVQQADGKLVAAGHSSDGNNHAFALVRYNSDGTLDSGFDSDGKVTTFLFSSNSGLATALVQQADGKLVAGGYSHIGNDDFALVRYNINGSLDTSFNASGKVVTAIGSSIDQVYSILQQSDGKLLAAGSSHNGSNLDIALARYNSDGSLDASFDGDGKLTTAIRSYDEYARAAVQQPDGKIVIAGFSNSSVYGGGSDFALVRYNSNGSLDTSFDGDGKLTTNFFTSPNNSSDNAYALIQQSDGKLVAAGRSNADIAIARYNSDGSLDTTFDDDGKLTTSFTAGADTAYSIKQQTDGKLVIAGYTPYNGNNGDDVILARYNSNGSLDNSFGNNGKVVIDLNGNTSDRAFALAVQSDDKLAIAGGSGGDFFVARFHAGFFDGDSDTIDDGTDNCLNLANTDQLNTDGDRYGNACDSDNDNDGLTDSQETTLGTDPLDANTDDDVDNDLQDAFPLDPAEWDDTDSDGTGNNADDNDDNDSLTDAEEIALGSDPLNTDSDFDGSTDGTDNCLLQENPDQANSDADALGDTCDSDDDNDGVPDIADQFPLDPLQSGDFDHDGLDNFVDSDDDNDGVDDINDAFPYDRFESEDTDSDGMPDTWEMYWNMDPNNSADASWDDDWDMLSNLTEYQQGLIPIEWDSDGDYVDDYMDAYPTNIHHAADDDADNMPDGWEAAHGLDPAYVWDGTADYDGDNLTNAEEFLAKTDPWDDDTDNDNELDGWDIAPLDPRYKHDGGNGLPYEWSMQQMPLIPAGDAYSDPDTDGLDNLAEYHASTNPNDNDSDNDGLPDGDDRWPTNPAFNTDNDADGLPDSWETSKGFNPADQDDAHNPYAGDGDLLSPLEEFERGSDPQHVDADADGQDDRHDLDPVTPHIDDRDSDFDGMPAWWENLPWNGCCMNDSYASDGFGDMDNDGVTNLQEFERGTFPDIAQDSDDDNDGMPNGWEAAHGLQPTNAFDGSLDPDGDGLSNTEEFTAGTDINDPDTDDDNEMDGMDIAPLDNRYKHDGGNGLPYEWSQAQSPIIPAGDAFSDPDLDGLNNLREYEAGTNPHHADTDMDDMTDGDDQWPTSANYNIDNDNDGLPDSWEISHGLNPNSAGDANNPLLGDNDLLTPLQEFVRGTNPNNHNTDSGTWPTGNDENDRHDRWPLDARYSTDQDFDGMPEQWENLPWNGCCMNDSYAGDGFDDMDNDGVTNLQEFERGTFPDIAQDRDDDNDGMPNGWEAAHGLSPGYNGDTLYDQDGDGLSNLDEFEAGTDPLLADSDHDGVTDGDDVWPSDNRYALDSDSDGLPDTYEDAHPPLDKNNSADAAFDVDMDALSNMQEFVAGTSPQVGDSDGDGWNDGIDPWPTNTDYNSDSDNDGLPDSWEMANGLNPSNANDAGDFWFGDNDLLSPLQEFTLGTNPQMEDTDGDSRDDRHDLDPTQAHLDGDEDKDFDGMPMWWEYMNWNNGCPMDDDAAFDGFDDCDSDGLTNLQEFTFGIDPSLADSDGDSISDYDEIFLEHTNPAAADTDGDGVNDAQDKFPLDAADWADNDLDGLGNNADPDDDNDGWLDGDDGFPFDPSQHDGNTIYPLDGLFRGSSIGESASLMP